MHSVYLLLGSNMGDREAWLGFGRDACDEAIGRVVHTSHIYETAPWGIEEQEGFLNQAIELQTMLEPAAVLEAVNRIEQNANRQRHMKWGPRTLDIDILLYEDLVISTPQLTLPNPELEKRNFALVPLAEIAPELMHPGLGVSIRELVERSTDHGEVSILPG